MSYSKDMDKTDENYLNKTFEHSFNIVILKTYCLVVHFKLSYNLKLVEGYGF